jgi:hypothetical protein
MSLYIGAKYLEVKRIFEELNYDYNAKYLSK